MTALQILFAAAGTILFGAAFAWRQSNVWRRAPTHPFIVFVISAAGALLEILAMMPFSRQPVLMISSMMVLAAVGAVGGETIVDEVLKRRPGMVHAVISTQRNTGLIWVSIVACACGLPVIVMRFIEPQKPGWDIYGATQSAFWIVFGLRMFFVARTKWAFAEPGILAPGGLIPWRNVLSYEWAGDDTLYLKVRQPFGSSRQKTIKTRPGVRDSAKPILEIRVATVWVNRNTTTPTANGPRSDTMALL